MTKIPLAALTTTLFICAPARAVEPSQCVDAEPRRGGGMDLRNNCREKLNVTYCVDNPDSAMSVTVRRSP